MAQSEGGGTGRGHVLVEKQAVEGNGPKWRPVVRQSCKGETAPCWNEEEESWVHSPSSSKLVQTSFEPNLYLYTGLFISPSGISELDCATTKTDTEERSISIGRESLQFFFVLGTLAYFQVPPLGGSREEKWR